MNVPPIKEAAPLIVMLDERDAALVAEIQTGLP